MSDNAIKANQVLRSWIRNGLISFDRAEKVIDALRTFDSEYRRKTVRGKTVDSRVEEDSDSEFDNSELPESQTLPSMWQTDGDETADDEFY